MVTLLHRPRRLRRSPALRSLVSEARLAPEDFVLPLFACPGQKVRREVSSMPGVFNLSVDEIAREAAEAFAQGVTAVILFGLPEAKRRNRYRRLRRRWHRATGRPRDTSRCTGPDHHD